MKSDRKRTILFIIILLVLSMGIGYAFLTTTLSIDGVSDIDSAVWDIHFENVQVQSGSITGSQVITPATISADGQTVSYHIKLKGPGDFYTFSVDAVNSGTLNAKIDNISFKVNGVEQELPPCIIKMLINDGSFDAVDVGQTLNAGKTKKYFFGIGYDSNVEADDLPDTDMSLSVSYQITYIQYTPVSIPDGTVLYSSSDTLSTIGDYIDENGFYYDNYQEALDRYGHYAFLKHTILNNVVNKSELGFEYNGNIYYVVGGDGGAAFSENESLLLNVFGSNNCFYSDGGNLKCSTTNFYVRIYPNGLVYTRAYMGYRCTIGVNGSSICQPVTD